MIFANVRHSLWLSPRVATPTGWISVKFDIREIYEDLSGNSLFGKNWAIMSVTLREEVCFIVGGDINLLKPIGFSTYHQV